MHGVFQSTLKVIPRNAQVLATKYVCAVSPTSQTLNSGSIFMRGYGDVIVLNEHVTHLAKRLGEAVIPGLRARQSRVLEGVARDEPKERAIGKAAQTASARVAVIVVDEAARICDVSEGVEKLFGVTTKNLADKPLTALFEPSQAESLFILLRKALGPQETAPFAVEFSFRGIDGRTLDLEVSCARSDAAGKNLCILAVRDISQLKFAEHRVAELTLSLQRAYSDFEKFAYVAAHDLRAPLRVIENASKWLEEDLERHLSDSASEDFALIKSRIDRMQTHLDLLLDYARLGKETDACETTGGREFISTFSNEITLPEGFHVEATREFLNCNELSLPLRCVLLSLLENAIEHHDKRQGRILIDVQSDSDYHRFHVIDDGPGIEPAYREKVFEMFQSLKSKDLSTSSGMGLTLARRRAEVAGGSIEIIGKQRRGTTVTVVWPRHATGPEPRGSQPCA